ncbi:MAG: hypothetical protein NVSMB43_25080 [Pseudarthrobacter sp.]
MTTISSTYLPRDAHQPRGKQPWCAACDTDLHLVVDSIAVMDRQRGALAVAVNCAKCGDSRVLSTTAGFVAAILARSSPNDDVVHVGAKYIHCGEPMSTSDQDHRSARMPVSTQPRAEDFLGVYLQTRVLRCRCGFQMELPQ